MPATVFAVLVILIINPFTSPQYSDFAIIQKEPYFIIKSKTPQNSLNLFDEGISFYNEDNYDIAIQKFNSYLKICMEKK